MLILLYVYVYTQQDAKHDHVRNVQGYISVPGTALTAHISELKWIGGE